MSEVATPATPVSAVGDESASDAGEEVVIDYGPDGGPDGDAPAGEESKAPAQEKAEKEPAPAPSSDDGEDEPELTPDQKYEALQSRFDKGEPLTTEEKGELRTLQQSRDDRERARTQARTQLQNNQARIKNLAETFPNRIVEHVSAELQSAANEGRGVSAKLLQTAISESVAELAKEGEPLFLLRWDAGIREKIVEYRGNTPETQKLLEGLDPGDFGSLLGAFGQSLYEKGQKENPEAKKVTRLEKQVAELKASLEKTKTTSGTKSTAGRETAARNLAPNSYAERLRNGESVNSDDVDEMVRRQFADALA